MSRECKSPARGVSGIRELPDRQETLDMETIGMEEIIFDNVRHQRVLVWI